MHAAQHPAGTKPSSRGLPPASAQAGQQRLARRQQRRALRALAAAAGVVDQPRHRPGSANYSREAGPVPCTRPLRIAVDIDEVLGRFLHALTTYVRDKHGLFYDVEAYHEYSFAKVWKCSPEKANEIVHAFFLSPQFAHGVLPIAEAGYHLQRLRRCHQLLVVTSRQTCIQEQTLQWLDQHFPHLFQEVHFGNHWALQGASRRKSDICRDLDADLLVDDNPVYACDCAEAGMDVILFDWHLGYPWSKTADGGPWHPRIQRVSDWAGVEEAVGRIASAPKPASC